MTQNIIWENTKRYSHATLHSRTQVNSFSSSQRLMCRPGYDKESRTKEIGRGNRLTVEQWRYVKEAPETLQVDIELRRLRLNSISRKDQNRRDVKWKERTSTWSDQCTLDQPSVWFRRVVASKEKARQRNYRFNDRRRCWLSVEMVFRYQRHKRYIGGTENRSEESWRGWNRTSKLRAR